MNNRKLRWFPLVAISVIFFLAGNLSAQNSRIVHQISTDGHAYRCSLAMDFNVVTRYHVAGEVRGNALVIHERTFEILAGSPCDDGQRRRSRPKLRVKNGCRSAAIPYACWDCGLSQTRYV